MRKMRYFLAMAVMMAAFATASAQQTLEQATDSIKHVLALAKGGDAKAQNEVGGWYYRGRHVPQDYNEALQWWSRSAQQGNVEAIGNMGLCYQTGHGIAQDSLKATQLYQKSIELGNVALLNQNIDLAQKGSVFSNMLVATCYREGKGVAKDVNKAIPFYVAAGNKGCVDAQRELGLIYLNGKKPQEALKWFRMGADQGDLSSTFWYGKMLVEGLGTAPDKKEGANYILKAANAGFPNAMFAIGSCYLDGDGVTRNPEQAVKWFKLAAGKGVGGAEWKLAQCCREGIGTPVSYEQALYWYASSLDKGYTKPFKNLITDSIPGSPFISYLNGMKSYQNRDFEAALKDFKAVEKAKIADGKVMTAAILANSSYGKQNLKKAVKLLTEAAAENPEADYLLAGLYEAGKGVDKDMAKAVSCLRQAADRDYAPAQCALADMYFEGRGVDQNYRKAVELYAKAYAQGQLNDNAAKRYASCWQEGLGGLTADPDKAREILDAPSGASVSALLKLL